jgi:hypothetical protein
MSVVSRAWYSTLGGERLLQIIEQVTHGLFGIAGQIGKAEALDLTCPRKK